jgi:hypothetical protein
MWTGVELPDLLTLISECVSVRFDPDYPYSSVRVSSPREALSLMRKGKVEYCVWNGRKEEVMISCFVDYIPILQSLPLIPSHLHHPL